MRWALVPRIVQMNPGDAANLPQGFYVDGARAERLAHGADPTPRGACERISWFLARSFSSKVSGVGVTRRVYPQKEEDMADVEAKAAVRAHHAQ